MNEILIYLTSIASIPPVAALIGSICTYIKSNKSNKMTCDKIKEIVDSVRDEIVNTKEYTELKNQLKIVHQENVTLKKKLNELLAHFDKVNRGE